MADTYANFLELARHERRGKDFRVRFRTSNSKTAIVAPHGGGIEPGTSEVANAIARGGFSFYAFEGTKARGNGRLHITSTRFDEPTCMALVSGAEHVIAIHGENSQEKIVFLGGKDKVCRDRIRRALQRDGFLVKRHPSVRLQGTDDLNICNRSCKRAGVQIELSQGLRRTFFRSISRSDHRKRRTQEFRRFIAAELKENGLGPSAGGWSTLARRAGWAAFQFGSILVLRGIRIMCGPYPRRPSPFGTSKCSSFAVRPSSMARRL
jgi:phage replication-related protein YjqB (UPF0714/DUF867 family)